MLQEAPIKRHLASQANNIMHICRHEMNVSENVKTKLSNSKLNVTFLEHFLLRPRNLHEQKFINGK